LDAEAVRYVILVGAGDTSDDRVDEIGQLAVVDGDGQTEIAGNVKVEKRSAESALELDGGRAGGGVGGAVGYNRETEQLVVGDLEAGFTSQAGVGQGVNRGTVQNVLGHTPALTNVVRVEKKIVDADSADRGGCSCVVGFAGGGGGGGGAIGGAGEVEACVAVQTGGVVLVEGAVENDGDGEHHADAVEEVVAGLTNRAVEDVNEFEAVLDGDWVAGGEDPLVNHAGSVVYELLLDVEALGGGCGQRGSRNVHVHV
jgi:hypothetical protein